MILRSTSFTDIKNCYRKAYYRYILGLYRKGTSINTDLWFGSTLHKAIKIFHLQGYTEAMHYLNSLTFPIPRNKYKNQETAKVLLNIYVKKAKSKERHVNPEEAFEFVLGNHVWRGRFDSISQENHTWLWEVKTSNPNYLVLKPNDQFTAYFIGCNAKYSKVDGMLVHNFDVQRMELNTLSFNMTEDEIERWCEETKLVADEFEFYCEKGVFPQNPQACYQYGRECEFFELCQSPQSEILIDSLYLVSDKLKNLEW